MYKVTETYTKAINALTRKGRITGTLTTARGVKYPLNDNFFVKDSFYTTNRCVNNNALEFGAVYAGECGFNIIADIDRYTLFDAKVETQYTIDTDKGVESVPLGVYYVDTAVRTGHVIKITAIDKMSAFDVSVTENTTGDWVSMIKYTANKCGVELEQTEEELKALHVNAGYSFKIDTEEVDTYRDALAYLCMMVAGFATINRDGKLHIGTYAIKTALKTTVHTRFSNCSFSDYQTRYKAITARFKADENFYPYEVADEKITYDALTLDMGDVPIVGGSPEYKQQVLYNILDTLKLISYTPASINIIPNPAIELGDLIECEGVNGSNETVYTYCMKYHFDYRKKMSINGYGDNPRLQNVSSKDDKALGSLDSRMSNTSVVIIPYTNVDKYTLRQEWQNILDMQYSVLNANNRPIIIITVPFSIDVDGYLEMALYNGKTPLGHATYKGYYEAGSHFATFLYIDEGQKDERRKIYLKARCNADKKSGFRVLRADTDTLKNAYEALVAGSKEYETVPPDSTEPTVTIGEQELKAVVYASGISSEAINWDGTIDLEEQFADIAIKGVGVEAFNATVGAVLSEPLNSGLVEVFHDIPIGGISIEDLLDYASNYTWGEMGNKTWYEAKELIWKKEG